MLRIHQIRYTRWKICGAGPFIREASHIDFTHKKMSITGLGRMGGGGGCDVSRLWHMEKFDIFVENFGLFGNILKRDIK